MKSASWCGIARLLVFFTVSNTVCDLEATFVLINVSKFWIESGWASVGEAFGWASYWSAVALAVFVATASFTLVFWVVPAFTHVNKEVGVWIKTSSHVWMSGCFSNSSSCSEWSSSSWNTFVDVFTAWLSFGWVEGLESSFVNATTSYKVEGINVSETFVYAAGTGLFKAALVGGLEGINVVFMWIANWVEVGGTDVFTAVDVRASCFTLGATAWMAFSLIFIPGFTVLSLVTRVVEAWWTTVWDDNAFVNLVTTAVWNFTDN